VAAPTRCLILTRDTIESTIIAEPAVMWLLLGRLAERCIDVRDKSCVDVCPVNCIYEGERMLYIHPDECIDCGACEPECPVSTIFTAEDVPPTQQQYIQINRDVFKGPNPPHKPTPR
jgi:ferredoxin